MFSITITTKLSSVKFRTIILGSRVMLSSYIVFLNYEMKNLFNLWVPKRTQLTLHLNTGMLSFSDRVLILQSLVINNTK